MPDFWGRCVIERNTGHTQLEEFDYLMYGPDYRAGALGFREKVVIIGGNAVGLKTALYLANQETLTPDILHFLMASQADRLKIT